MSAVGVGLASISLQCDSGTPSPSEGATAPTGAALPSVASAASSVSRSGDASSSSALTQRAIDQIALERRPALMIACADAARQANLDTVQVLVELDATGGVNDAAVAGGGARERALRKCVEERVLTWKFPAPDVAPKNASFTLSFAK